MHSRRSATPVTEHIRITVIDFNPCTPDGVQHELPDGTRIQGRISIHALQTECNQVGLRDLHYIKLFQSMHSRRSATIAFGDSGGEQYNFNPCTPDGVQHSLQEAVQSMVSISIHALQTECNILRQLERPFDVISIHALQTECNF